MTQYKNSLQDIINILTRKAEEMLGKERAKEMGPFIVQAAEAIYRIANDPPRTNETPVGL